MHVGNLASNQLTNEGRWDSQIAFEALTNTYTTFARYT
jgi:hypothetical protein